MAEAPYTALAEARMHSRGKIIKKYVITTSDHKEVDVTEAVLRGDAIPEHKGVLAVYRQDVDKAAEELALEVDHDPLSFDAALQLVSEQIRKGAPVPSALRPWAAKAIVGETKRPKSPSKIKGATVERDRLILRLLDMLVDKVGLNATSGDRRNGQSACHAVAQAFSLLRLQPDSYDSILGVWRRRDSSELRAVRVPRRV